jgi:hypothetical protein
VAYVPTRQPEVTFGAENVSELRRINQPVEKLLRVPLGDPFEGDTPGFGSV